MNNPVLEINTLSPRVIPLSWVDGQLRPEPAVDVSRPATEAREEEITILHTNDLHSSVDGRRDAAGEIRGGLARIATTVRRARVQGPTLVFDIGDFVFGAGTWWDIQGPAPVARLRARAGCDLATIGNHDLERGHAGLRELLQGGCPFVSANLYVADPAMQRHIRPAYIIEIAGWRIGVTGLTTLSTLDLVSARLLQGISLTEPRAEFLKVIAALDSLVDTIVVLSHLGFYESGPGDPDLARHATNSRVSLILGGHTHAALEPARVINGVTICSAGAFGMNVGEVKLRRAEDGSIEVHTQLLPQSEAVPGDPAWLEARSQETRSFEPLQETILPLPVLPEPVATEWNRDREWTLLVRSLHALGVLPSSAILMLPRLYVSGQLPIGKQATLAELLSTYTNIEYLMLAEISGKILKELIALQPDLLYYQQARPLRLSDESEVPSEQVEEQSSYSIITSELVCEGGLGWHRIKDGLISTRSLQHTCLQIVQAYLTS
ncbi:MAG: hypothetical protein NVSMB44_12050 [Ktedonobacteraceae bacterium]